MRKVMVKINPEVQSLQKGSGLRGGEAVAKSVD